MKYFCFLLLFFCQNIYCQTSQLQGMIINAEDNSKLASASIFINNSSKGTMSNENGIFNLQGTTEQNFDLIVSYTGFVTVSIKITPENIGQFLTIKMHPRKETMQGVSIMVPDKDGWKKWGKLFSETFLGVSDFAKNCSIENPKAMRFFDDKKHDRFTAYSNGSLVIRNKALGYLIRFQLEAFDYNFKTTMVTYSGYSVFEDLKTNSPKKRSRWLKARKEAYYGSMMHFMRAVFSDSVSEQGFDVREKIRIYNTDSLFKRIYVPGNMPTVKDGDETYKAIAGEIPSFKKIPDYVDLINVKNFSFKDAVTFDSIANQKEFYFDNYIQVIYKNAVAKMDYLLANGLPKYLKMNQRSDARLLSNDPLIIEKDGSYFDPVNIISSGYWGWYKMAEMLPSDYKPAE